MRLLIVAIVFLFAVQSQPPTPRPTPSGHASQQEGKLEPHKSNNDDETTKQLVAAIQQLTAAITAQNQKQTTAETNTKAPAEKFVKITTIFITIFTGILAVLAILQWRTMHLQSKYLRDTERARLDVNIINNGRGTYYVNINNLGRSLGILTELGFSHASFPEGTREYSLDHAVSKFEDGAPFNHMFAPDQPPFTIHQFIADQFLTEQEKQGTHFGIFSVYIVYLDIFGHEHETEVLYRWRHINPVLENVPDYNRYE